MLTLSRDQFLEALGHLFQHPRITLGRTTPVTVESDSIKPRLKVEPLPDRRLELTAAMPGQPANLLIGGTTAWRSANNQVQPVARVLPIAYFPLLHTTVILAADQSEDVIL